MSTKKFSVRSRRNVALAAAGTLLATLGLSACGSSSGSGSAPVVNGMPTVTMMVGGIDKQIYLPYELAQNLGFYKKYGVNMQLSTETQGGIGAEDAMASGQVDFAGAWYVHTFDFQSKGKDVISVAQLSAAPGERVMCSKNSGVTTPADFKGKSIGVTDLGSGTDDLIQQLASHYGLNTSEYHRVGVGDGATLLSSLQQGRVACAITTQPTVNAVEKAGAGVSVLDLSSPQGATKWLGGTWPAAAVLAQSDWVKNNQATVQKVVDALVATMHWIHTHTAADIANALPQSYVSNGLTSKSDYIATLQEDLGQFLPDGMMPSNGPATVQTTAKIEGDNLSGVSIPGTYTNQYVVAANKALGFGG
ncbi:ABC transporter substrate-binding protein [Streptacidiphilus fuscans]|uniref:ABC transporter substrate-binding protein n=1 Tax=Streptacidiphilus fuscans TaxID=2789292 RepID=A0A931B775_9ACTN|nr:ABC transporter substrate-binding protein [Streptacidiphilus fuscans]MBF9072490.1 ABC transporter substrate-binding protein [Streptacidiphilus fuscans]